MTILLSGFAALTVFLCLLVFERGQIARRRDRIPLRICITGTRGKSSVTRQIAAALRASGRTVLAKTTGSKPVLILPDGTEREIDRPGQPTVLEQKKVLALAARLGADALVVEMMSIGPECLAVESGKIFRPGMIVVTNVRLDHEEEMGETVEAVAESLAAAISPRSTVLVPVNEWHPVFDQAARKKKSGIVPLALDDRESLPPGTDFPENVRLSLAVADYLGVDRETALRGIAGARQDFGSLRIWSMASPVSGRTWHFASIFAANELQSTRIALDRIRERIPFQGRRAIVLLYLRADRASRTRRWLSAVREGFFAGFDRIVFIGEQASALGRRPFPAGLEIEAVEAASAPEVAAALWPMSEDDTIVVGAGNIAGIGRALVEFWEAQGTSVAC